MMRFLKWGLIGFVALIVLAAIFGKDETKSGSSTTTTTPASASTDSKPADVKPAEQKPAAVAVTANDLVKAYKENEVAANEKFKGKQLLIGGTIESIDAGITDKPTIILKTSMDYGMNNPQADLADSDIKKASALKKGQSIKMLCVGNSEVAGTPMLDDCVIQ